MFSPTRRRRSRRVQEFVASSDQSQEVAAETEQEWEHFLSDEDIMLASHCEHPTDEWRKDYFNGLGHMLLQEQEYTPPKHALA